MIPALTIVTVSSHRPHEDYYCYDEFFESCKDNDTRIVVLGQRRGEYKGLASKPKLLKKALDTGQIPSPYILFCDSWDLVLSHTPQELLLCYKEAYSETFDLVANAEKNCFPRGDWADLHPPTKGPYRYLNSGFIIGRTEAMHNLLTFMAPENIPDDHRNPVTREVITPNDQEFFMDAFLRSGVKMGLDSDVLLCQTMCGLDPDELDFSGSYIKNVKTGSYPMSFHFNGGSKTDGFLKPVLNKLGYPR